MRMFNFMKTPAPPLSLKPLTFRVKSPCSSWKNCSRNPEDYQQRASTLSRLADEAKALNDASTLDFLHTEKSSSRMAYFYKRHSRSVPAALNEQAMPAQLRSASPLTSRPISITDSGTPSDNIETLLPDSNAKQLIRPTPFLIRLPEVVPVATSGVLSAHHASRQARKRPVLSTHYLSISRGQTLLFLYPGRFKQNIAGKRGPGETAVLNLCSGSDIRSVSR